MLKKTVNLVLVLSIVLLASSLSGSRTLAQGGAAELRPVSQNLQVGEVTTVALYLGSVTGLFGYQVGVAFDPAILEVIDADPSSPGTQVTLGNFLQADFVQQNNADNSTGQITCVVSQLAPTSAVSGSGDLLSIAFRAKADGASDVRFTDIKLAKSDGTEIMVTRLDARISVGVVVVPTSTPTIAPTSPSPTATPGGPTATPTPVATPGQTVIYVVRMGDTLSAIARRFGVTLASLVQINIANPSLIYVGQQIIIPRGTTVPPVPPPSTGVYIVQWGDTLYSIARRFGTTANAIAIQNNIANPSLIYAGQRLVIPGGTVSPPPSGQIHVVKTGETLSSIARLYGTTYWAIAMANNLANPNIIYVGQRLAIP